MYDKLKSNAKKNTVFATYSSGKWEWYLIYKEFYKLEKKKRPCRKLAEDINSKDIDMVLKYKKRYLSSPIIGNWNKSISHLLCGSQL